MINTTTTSAISIIDVLNNIQNDVMSAGDIIGERGAEDDFNKQINGYLNQIDTIIRSSTSNRINILASIMSNGFDISGTSLSYVTSCEGNTASIRDAFELLKESDEQQVIKPALNQVDQEENNLTSHNFNSGSQTLFQDLGLTESRAANGLSSGLII